VTASDPADSSPRQRILDVTLALMAQRGVDGTSMRDLASATGLNVASLYHYFPSKRDLLLAVLAERGMMDELALPFSESTPTSESATQTERLTELLDTILESMLELEDFVRLMLGEAMRGQETVQNVGKELISTTQEALERWLTESQPELTSGGRAPALARALRAFLIGLFFEHVSGIMDDEGDPSKSFRERASEMAAALRPEEA
jgi:AcrR family transcriptional regulator